jgi:DNA-binding winged helix-turn-helix (wHTH) protein
MDGNVVLEAFSFGPFRVVPYARLLECDGSPAPLGSRAFDILCLLISRPGEVVSKRELMARVWPNERVEESSLRFNISLLRRALGDGKGGERYVVNVPGRGYCFVAGVGRAA